MTGDWYSLALTHSSKFSKQPQYVNRLVTYHPLPAFCLPISSARMLTGKLPVGGVIKPTIVIKT